MESRQPQRISDRQGFGEDELPFVDLPWIGGAFTAPETHSAENAAAIKVSDDLVVELKAADRIVIGTPMYSFAIPAVLKAYIDNIVRVGVTVTADNKGLLTGKSADIILVSGGDSRPALPSNSTIRPAATYAKSSPG